MRLRIAVAVMAAALAGCGAQSASDSGDEDVVARPVAPPELAETTPTPEDSASETELPEGESPEETMPAASTTTREGATDTSRPGAILSAADLASFRRLVSSLGGESGLAVSGVGAGQRVERAGTLQSGVAWSTAKVPIAMAAIDAGKGASQDIKAAITASDNAAATRLWGSLGSPQAAAAAATAELRRGGDQRTSIESRPLRGAGYTPFGQTSWTLSDQARFTAALPCSASGAQVLGLMNDVIPSQRWGLGAASVPAQLKGGWGPGTRPGVASGYLDRQMGMMTISGKPLAVTIANRAANGSHESATSNLSAIARWLKEHASVSGVPTSPDC